MAMCRDFYEDQTLEYLVHIVLGIRTSRPTEAHQRPVSVVASQFRWISKGT